MNIVYKGVRYNIEQGVCECCDLLGECNKPGGINGKSECLHSERDSILIKALDQTGISEEEDLANDKEKLVCPWCGSQYYGVDDHGNDEMCCGSLYNDVQDNWVRSKACELECRLAELQKKYEALSAAAKEVVEEYDKGEASQRQMFRKTLQLKEILAEYQ